jgi:hypothetical protein
MVATMIERELNNANRPEEGTENIPHSEMDRAVKEKRTR